MEFLADAAWYETAGTIIAMVIGMSNVVTMSFPSIIGKTWYDIPMKLLNFLSLNVFKNKNADAE